jgi:hypothetical protein
MKLDGAGTQWLESSSRHSSFSESHVRCLSTSRCPHRKGTLYMYLEFITASQNTNNFLFLCRMLGKTAARGSADGWGAILQAGKSRFRILRSPLDLFSVCLFLPTDTGDGLVSASNRNNYEQSYLESRAQSTCKAGNLTAISESVI